MGIRTLIAPFAFVAPDYDCCLDSVRITTDTEDVFRLRTLFKLFGRVRSAIP